MRLFFDVERLHDYVFMMVLVEYRDDSGTTKLMTTEQNEVKRRKRIKLRAQIVILLQRCPSTQYYSTDRCSKRR